MSSGRQDTCYVGGANCTWAWPAGHFPQHQEDICNSISWYLAWYSSLEGEFSMSTSSPVSFAPSRSNSLSYSTSTPPRASSSRHNPISLRIYKAIGTSFDDPGSREALEIASSFYAPALEDKEKADLVEDERIPERRTLKGQSAAMARKHLKRDIEGRLAGGSRKFLVAFGEVDKVCILIRPPVFLQVASSTTRRL